MKKDAPQAQPPAGQDTLKDARTSNRVFSGKASFYAYSMSKTASGSSFNRNLLTAAHRNLPFGTKVRVTHGRSSVIVTINDRGPFVRGRVLDLSLAAAQSLGITELGVVQIRAEVL
ncbi:septal ring lytic transglycosylase RlpA family protein [Bradyrhizobium sp. 23AC]